MSSITLYIIGHGSLNKGSISDRYSSIVNYFNPEPVTGALISAGDEDNVYYTLLEHLKQITKTKQNPTDIIKEFCKFNKELYEDKKRNYIEDTLKYINSTKTYISEMINYISTLDDPINKRNCEKKVTTTEYNLMVAKRIIKRRNGYNKKHEKYNKECKFWKLKKDKTYQFDNSIPEIAGIYIVHTTDMTKIPNVINKDGHDFFLYDKTRNKNMKLSTIIRELKKLDFKTINIFDYTCNQYTIQHLNCDTERALISPMVTNKTPKSSKNPIPQKRFTFDVQHTMYDKILNPATNRYVLKSGVIGKKLLKQQNIQ